MISSDSGTTWERIGSDMAASFEEYGYEVRTYFDLRDLNFPYVDLDGTKRLYLVLENLSPISKVPGVDGEIVIEVEYELAT